MIPSEEEAISLHRKCGSNAIIIEHCRTVAKVSMILAEGFRSRGVVVDVKAVKAGALLHDLGRSRVQTVKHGFVGAELIENEGVDKKVVEIVRRHVGAGISPEEARSLGLPPFDYVPKTLEERIVCFSDKMVDSSTVRPFDREVERFTKESHDVKRLLSLKQGLQELLGKDPERLIFEKIKESS